MDVATLSFAIDSSEIKQADAALEGLKDSSDATADAALALSRAQREAAGSAAAVAQAQKAAVAAQENLAAAALQATAAEEAQAVAMTAAAAATDNFAEKEAEAAAATANLQARLLQVEAAAATFTQAEIVSAEAVAQAAQAKTRAAQASENLSRAMVGMEGGTKKASSAMMALRLISGQLGYQVSDVFTQISMGGNAMQALAVQGSQLFGVLSIIPGPIGQIGTGISVALPVAQALWQSFDHGSEEAKKLHKELEQNENRYNTLTQNTDTYKNALKDSEPYQIAYLQQMIELGKASETAAANQGMLAKAVGAVKSALGGLTGLSASIDEALFGSTPYSEKTRQEQIDRENARRHAEAERLRPVLTGQDRRADEILQRNREKQAEGLRVAGLTDPSDAAVRAKRDQRMLEDSKGIVAQNAALTSADKAWEAHLKSVAAAAKATAAEAERLAAPMKKLQGYADETTRAIGNIAQQRALLDATPRTMLDTKELDLRIARLNEEARIEERLNSLRGKVPDADIKRVADLQMQRYDASVALQKAEQDRANAQSDQIAREKEQISTRQQQADSLKALQEQTDQMMNEDARAKVQQMRDTFVEFGQAAVAALEGFASGSKDAKEALVDLGKTWLNMLVQMAMQRALMGMASAMFPMPVGAATAGAGAAAAGGMAYGGPRASGGPVDSGRAYMVGERGPEMFVPAGRGKIVPGGKGGGPAVLINHAPVINLSGSANDEDADRMAAAMNRELVRTIDQRLAWHARSSAG